MKKTLLASAVLFVLAANAHAVTYDTQYEPDGTIDLRDVGGEFIVNNATGTGLVANKTYAIGTDKDYGKIEITGTSSVYHPGAAGSMTADTILLKSTSSNGMTLYQPLTLTGNNVTIDATYNAVQLGENYKASLKIDASNVTISSKQHVALHGTYGGDIEINADNLTITAPKAIQTMTDGASVVINAKVANITGDITSGGKDNTIVLSMEEGTFKGRVTHRGDYDASSGATLNLGEKATWVLTDGEKFDSEGPYYGTGFGDSVVENLNVKGTIDMSQVDRNITVTNTMSGDATVKVDAAKTNTLTVQGESTATVSVVTDQNADEVTQEQAAAMVTRMAGVEATAFVEEGMYNGAMNVGADGVVATETNSIMSNTLDLASAAPLAMNRLLMNDVRKRMGDLRAAEGTHGVWARYDGGKLSGERGLENDFTTVQVGIDTVPVADAPRFGVAFAYTTSEADMMRGSADMDAFSLAFYGTKMYDNGMFVDVIGRMATADTDIVVDGDKKGSMDNVALSLSGELGWRFDVTDKFYFEPQAELTYTYVNADKLALGGSSYEFDSVDSLMGRVGFAAGFKCPNNFGDVYVRASAVHEFLGDSAVTGGNGTIHEVDGDDTWVEFGIGGQFNINKNTYVYADIERTDGAKLEEDWRANVGVRFAF